MTPPLKRCSSFHEELRSPLQPDTLPSDSTYSPIRPSCLRTWTPSSRPCMGLHTQNRPVQLLFLTVAHIPVSFVPDFPLSPPLLILPSNKLQRLRQRFRLFPGHFLQALRVRPLVSRSLKMILNMSHAARFCKIELLTSQTLSISPR